MGGLLCKVKSPQTGRVRHGTATDATAGRTAAARPPASSQELARLLVTAAAFPSLATFLPDHHPTCLTFQHSHTHAQPDPLYTQSSIRAP